MSMKKKFTCDVCGKPIHKDDEDYQMVTLTVTATDYCYDDGSNDIRLTYYMHKTKTCWGKVLKLLQKG
jgi:hypothetical protein